MIAYRHSTPRNRKKKRCTLFYFKHIFLQEKRSLIKDIALCLTKETISKASLIFPFDSNVSTAQVAV
jgi:hypothetical protein